MVHLNPYDVLGGPDAPGSLSVRATPYQDNVAAADLFTRMVRTTAQDIYHDTAEGALRLCAATSNTSPDYALAADNLLTYPLMLVVAGTPGETGDAHCPGKIRPIWPTR